MTVTDQEHLAAEIDAHLRTLRSANTQATAVEWMKDAYNLMARAADDLKRPRVFSVPGHFGVPTFMLTPPKALVLPPHQPVKPLGFFDPRVKTVVYGDKYSNTRAWTRADTRRLERQNAQKARA
jgi:hypothetical protein